MYLESDLNVGQSVKSGSSKNLKRLTRKHDDSYLKSGFYWTGSDDNPFLACLFCGKMSNESVLSSKLDKHFKSKHSHLQGKPTSFFKRISEQQIKTASSFESIMTVFDKAQIVSYQVSELIAQI